MACRPQSISFLGVLRLNLTFPQFNKRARRKLASGVVGMKKRSYIGLALGALVVVGPVLSLPSCGNDKKLVNI